MSEIDLAIIEILKKDARTSFREIARKLRVSTDTISNRYRNLRRNGVIQGSTVVINPQKIGYNNIIALMIDAEPEYSSKILNQLIQMVDIILATKTIGEWDLMAICVVRDYQHIFDLTLKVAVIPHVKDVQVSSCLGDIRIRPEYFII